MTRSTTSLAAAAISLLASVAQGSIVLDFTDPSPAGPSDNTAGETLETGASFMVSGLTVTATPIGDNLNSDGLLANADSLGVDSDNVGAFTDVPNHIQFDGGEKLALSFDQDIEILVIDLQGLSPASEIARVTAGGFSIDLQTGVSGFNGTADRYTPTTPIFVAAGTQVIFEATQAGDDFGLQEMEVNVLKVVPEPSTYLIFAGLALCFGLVGWRRRRSRNA